MNPILVIEDDEMLSAGLCYNLILEDYNVESANSIAIAKEKFLKNEYALLLADVNLPDGNGLDFSRWVRKQSQVPIMFLTACDMDEDMIKGFEAGADDYITKPFNIRILMQRVQAILRRYERGNGQGNLFECGNLEIDFEVNIVKKGGKPLALTPTEYKLLCKFCNNKGTILTRKVLLDNFWDQQGNFVDEHTLTINISRLRSKIADDSYTYIKTIYGMGYQWIGENHE